MKNFFISTFNFIKENIVGIILVGILAACLCSSLTALSISKTTRSQLETLSEDYLNFSKTIYNKLESIDDKVELVKDFALSDSNIQFGDTHIYHSNSKSNNSKTR